jgi:glycosyltransferase involved in cell wall biosynthesis
MPDQQPKKSEKPSISIITATYNAEKLLPNLVSSLRAQTDKRFEWIVVDGASKDGTVEILKSIEDLPISWISESDFGIYDALNKGIKLAQGEYYLVLGADDWLYPDAIGNYIESIIRTSPDILTAGVKYGNGKVLYRPKGRSWFNGQMAFVTGHAVGSVYRKCLHDKVGFFSKKYPITADQLFTKKAVQSGANVVCCDFVAGCFGSAGVSSVDIAGVLTEFFRVQLETERKFPQVVLHILRLLKHYRKL